jgi:hypothetical protein
VRGAVKGTLGTLRWAWDHQRPSAVALLIAAAGDVLLITGLAPWPGIAIMALAVTFAVAWGRGYHRGYVNAQIGHLKASIEQMEEICAIHQEVLAADHPARVDAANHLAALRQLLREAP